MTLLLIAGDQVEGPPTPRRLSETAIVRELLQTRFPGSALEHRLWDDTRVDLLTAEHAIEADWSRKWPEGVGQALYYALVTQRRPGLLLLVRDLDDERRYVYRAQTVCASHGIRMWVYDVERREMR